MPHALSKTHPTAPNATLLFLDDKLTPTAPNHVPLLAPRIGFGESITSSLEGQDLRQSTTIQMRAAEWLALSAVAGAVGALVIQLSSGADVWDSGMSGIDRFMCEASVR